MAALLREALLARGHEVISTGEGLRALTTMLEAVPDLVVADVMMPEMGGAPLLTAMRDNAYLSEIPVILVSGLSEDQVQDTCSGYTAFLRKPFSMQALYSTVDSVLSARP